MSDSDDDWTGFLGDQTDSEDEPYQPISARHNMQDRKRKISSSNQPKILKKSKTDFEVSFWSADLIRAGTVSAWSGKQ